MYFSRSLQTIPNFLVDTVTRRGGEPALGSIRDGQLEWHTWREVFDKATHFTVQLLNAGVQTGDRVAHISENRYEWVITDLALHLAGAVHVPMHVSLSGEQLAAQIADCEARLVIVSSDALLAKIADRVPSGMKLWSYEHGGFMENAFHGTVERPLDEGGSAAVESNSPVASSATQALATILYTSGTTGKPRGVMLSQRNLASNAAATADAFGADTDQVRLNILPLSHIYARTCDLYTWIYRGSGLVIGEGRETLPRDLQLVRPTAFNAVPYLYQRVADRIRASCSDPNEQASRLKAYFGGCIEMLCCGGAPLSPEVEAWFEHCGIPVLPGYGLTESSPVITASTSQKRRAGSVGVPVEEVELRIAEDGEVLTRGPNVMLGYWKDAAGTEDVIRDGWLHTGDLGSLDADGYLTISGRKKEMIVLSTGKKVHPARIESLLAASPLIEQAAVFGEGKPYLGALIVPANAGTLSDGKYRDGDKIVQECSRLLADASHEEQVRSFVLLKRPFQIEQGEMTPKLSLCREVIADHFRHEVDSLHD